MLQARHEGVQAILTGKVALVTGGGTGIGRAISKTLAKKGARIAVASRNPAHLESAKNELKFSESPVMGIPMDIRNKEEVRRGVSQVLGVWERIDILVNNAGVSGLNRIDDEEDGMWYEIVDTNLTGTYLTTNEVLRSMKNHAGGRIIKMGSVLR